MKNFILTTIGLSLVASVSMASPLFCDLNIEFSYNSLVFKKSNTTESGFLALVETTSGKRWVPAYEHFIQKQNGFRLRGIVREGKTFEACGELNSDGLSISKISEN